MWQVFFEELGAEVVISPSTTPAMLAAGSSRVVSDTCLPTKVFLGHVLSLVDRCDYVFIPAVRSTRKYAINCSKFLGLPDMTRAVIPECPPILEIDIDIGKGKRTLYREIYRLGRHFTWDPLRVRRAALTAWHAYLENRDKMVREQLTLSQAMGEYKAAAVTAHGARPAIALIGHPYLLYDDYVNQRLVYRLEQAGCRVVTPETATRAELESASIRLSGTPYWTYEEEIVGSGGHFLESQVDGVIGITAFGCGPDSLMMDMVRRRAGRLNNIPFMSLTLEEHTAEAGLVTRLEAFTDMIHRRKKGA